MLKYKIPQIVTLIHHDPYLLISARALYNKKRDVKIDISLWIVKLSHEDSNLDRQNQKL